MGSKQSQPADATPQEINEAEGKAAKKGGVSLTGDTFELKRDRGCTDILSLIILIVFWGGMLAVGIIAFSRGDPARLQNGYDFHGNICGTGANANKTLLYYPYPYNSTSQEPDLSWAACVTECPCQVGCGPVSIGASSVPNMCMMPFKVRMDNNVTVTCGGQEGGKTDMEQFTELSALRVLGFKKYCMKHLPKCEGCNNDTCCDGTNQIDDQSTTMDEAVHPELSQTGVPVGHKYGFCFVPYPSVKTSFLTRCVPHLDANSEDIERALSNFNGSSTYSTDGASSMVTGFEGVMAGFNSPSETFNTLMNEVNEHKHWIAVSSAIAIGISLLYTLLLRIAALPLALAIMFTIWGLLGLSTGMLFFKAGIIDQSLIPVDLQGGTMNLPDGMTLDAAKSNQQMLYAAAVIVAVIFVIDTFLTCIMVPRVILAIKVINIASSAVASMPSLILCPILQVLWMIILFVWWIAVFIYVAGVGEWNESSRTYTWDDQTRWAALYHFFGLLWGRAFILACGQLVVAGAAAEWFLANDKKMMRMPVINSIGRTMRYHLGTAGFGSILIAIVQFIRWVFRYYMYQMKKLDQEGKIVKMLTCIGECCLWCLEKFLDFINKNAYIQTAITGANFCSAAGAASGLLIRNCLRLGAITLCSSLFVLLGKIFIAVVTAVITALLIVGGDWMNITNAPVFSMVIVVLLAYAVGSCFLDVWDMCIDTIFQAYLMDLEMGTGKATGELKNFVAENEPKGKDKVDAASHL